MLVVHALWDTKGMALWAEDSAAPTRTVPQAAVRPHPYAASAKVLRAALRTLAGDDGALAARIADAPIGDLPLLLPEADSRPLPSPALGAPSDPATVRRPALRPWKVPACLLPPVDAATLLSALHDGAPDGLDLGPGLRHLSAVAAFAARLTSSGRLLPLVDSEPPSARWRPVLTGPDAAHFTALVRALPPSARAHLDPGDTGGQASALVFDALCALTDAVARARLTLAGPLSAPAWTRPLRRPDPTSGVPVHLAGRTRAWQHEAHRAGASARLLFRLAEPEQDGPATGETWRVEFWVQSGTEPSLQLPLRSLWLGEGAAWLPEGVETGLLRDLARAARYYPALSPVLRELAPEAIETGTGGAHAFIRDVAPRLSAAGFGVVLPQWAGRRSLGLRLTTRERGPGGSGGIGTDDLVDFSLDAVLGEDTIDLDELAELARLKQPLVRVRGRWVEVDPAHLRTALEFLRRRGRGRMRREEALRLAVAPDPGTPLPVRDVDADGALGALLDGSAERHLEPMPTPAGFTGTLRPYQERGAAWLRFLGELGLGAVLADDMGLGKTVQLLALIADEHDRAPAGPTLLVCPVSLVGNWQREAAAFAPNLRVHVHHGPGRPRGNDLARLLGHTDLVVTTYGVVVRDRAELAAMPWRRVVCDEAQAIKNSETRQARAVRELPATSRIALTGTPVENNLGELWSIMEFANPGLLGSAFGFRQAISAKIEADADGVAGREATALLKRLTGPFILRRVKTDRSIISDLPDKLEMTAWCTLTPEQASLYKATVDDMLERVEETEGIERKGLVLATMARLKQICNHPAQFLADGSALTGRSGKLERLELLLEEALAEGDKALCFTQYTSFGDRLAPYLAARLGRQVLWLHGGTPRHRREEMTAHFQKTAEPMVFLLSLKAAGTGLNLTAANHVVHIDRWWNPAVEEQATDRAFRIGQRRDVQVRKLVCVGTLEERVDEMIQRKRALAESVVGTGEEWLTELSTEQLREVVRLSPEAVAQ
ncbi:DEAD/DEAH box helicase [Marinactinospora endophytica]